MVVVLAGHLVEFGVVLAADGAHGGAQRVLALFDGCDLGLDRVEIDKPGFEDGLRHSFEGLVDVAVKVYFSVKETK
ncbi:hypothetical protein HMPREF2947_02855 [Pseudomonas aeruginosa]|nr:hypothetical protein HMPREF2947_02855 [Pseudomonas aeruginosa]